eukprot:TRINITY_DN13268_c0_g1_i2.p1 TRINITY_DN13268_c0_g1~~TRINITY_DN13268_c0_g1_i2.p1  ORF type:complete len:167 (+),score=42.10 TRINITY_DN13268_c0_g1_i2:286-786(+)
MKKEMHDAKSHHKDSGIGLSCPQVSADKRGFILLPPSQWTKTGKDRYKDFLCFLNPRILKLSERTKLHWEGCLSFPKYFVPNCSEIMLVERAEWAMLEFFDEEGIKHCMSLGNMVGRVALHEMDHLEGVVMADRAKEVVKLSEIEGVEEFEKFVKANAKHLDLIDV